MPTNLHHWVKLHMHRRNNIEKADIKRQTTKVLYLHYRFKKAHCNQIWNHNFILRELNEYFKGKRIRKLLLCRPTKSPILRMFDWNFLLNLLIFLIKLCKAYVILKIYDILLILFSFFCFCSNLKLYSITYHNFIISHAFYQITYALHHAIKNG